MRVNRWYIHLDDLKSLYQNINIRYSTINNHENFNVETISNKALSNILGRRSLSHDFEISNSMDLLKKKHETPSSAKRYLDESCIESKNRHCMTVILTRIRLTVCLKLRSTRFFEE